jgi:hypothetical protein
VSTIKRTSRLSSIIKSEIKNIAAHSACPFHTIFLRIADTGTKSNPYNAIIVVDFVDLGLILLAARGRVFIIIQ